VTHKLMPQSTEHAQNPYGSEIGIPQTYIKGPHFRGYLHCEVKSLRYTRFERARIIGARALQISLGAPVLLDLPGDTIDPIEISIMEYEKSVIPMTVKRD